MLTVREIKAAAKEVEDMFPGAKRYGCYWLRPQVALRCVKTLDEDTDLEIKVGDIVHADKVDEKGRYQDHVHLVEKGFWWPVANFELYVEPPHECYNPYGGKVVELNDDGSGIINSNFANREQYVFRSDQVFGNKSGLQKGSSITFTLNTENKIHCVHTRN